MKLRIKLLVLLLLISLVPLLLFSEFLSEKSMEEIREKTENGIMKLTEAKAEEYDRIFNTLEKEIETASQEIGERWGEIDGNINYSYIWFAPNGSYEDVKNFANVFTIIKGICSRNKEVSLAYFGTESGILFLSDSKTVDKLKKIGTFDHRIREWYIEAKNEGKNVWTEYIDVNTGEVTLSDSQPVYTRDGRFIGVVSLDLPLPTIKSDILDIKFENNGYAILVDRNGNIVVHPNYTAGNKTWEESFPEHNIKNISGLSLLYGEIKNGSHGIQRIKMSSTYYAAYYPLRQINGSLVFILPEEVVSEPIEKMRSLLWFVAISISIAVIAISIFFSLGITKPIEKLKKATTEIAKGNLEYTVDISPKDEIGELAKNFNEMVMKLKELTKSLEESEKKYRDIFDYSLDAVYISNEKGKLLDINKAGEELFGYSKKELMRINVTNLYVNKEDRERFKREIEKRGYVKNFEVKLRRKDGKEIDCLLSSVMFKKEDEIIYQGIIKDITPIKEARKELEVYNSLLRHDISNRLQIALGIMELIKDEEKDKELKELVKKAFDNLLSIKDLLLKLRMISRAYEIKLKKAELDKAIKESMEYFVDVAEEKGIKIHYNGAKAKVLADEMLSNIFSNIIENAIKHSNCRNIYINVRENGKYYVVEIKNDGEKIPDEIKDAIFEMGVKGKGSNGSGLGLHLVKKIVEKYGGKIEVRSNEKETSFELYLLKA